MKPSGAGVGGGGSGPIGAVVGALLRAGRSPWVRAGFLVLCIGAAVVAVASERDQVTDAARRLGAVPLLLALIASLANVLLAGMSWRAVLADLSSPLPLRAAARVFLLGQLGKYVPGSVLQVMAQAELGREYGVPRRRSASALVVQLIVAVTTALLLVLVAAPFASGEAARRFGPVLLLVPALLVVLHPRLLNPLLNGVLRRFGREPLEHPTSVGGTARSGVWALLSWLAAGVQVTVLAVALGAPLNVRTVALSIGGYCLAWAVGFLVVVAPAGAGAREAALAAALSPVLDGAELVVLVLASRVLLTVADLALAGVGAALGTRRPPGTVSDRPSSGSAGLGR